ncbi:protein kinase [Actinoplanes sp. TRM 88003]|uniref:non-specific serine/threonine protein kinase n=1 Tax=Paractinoplanes aksuensis TaxID=2939490 RepID=A0ABT1DXF0_9ACTN|nr:protein kinase [Actinoplanes aksuensis]MCO8275538.1 protein kinase [Actinoplanes aksuensis]
MSGSSTPSDRGLVAGRYRLLDLLGQGGMGRVWEAHDELLGRAVAIKEVAPEGLSPAELGDLHERAIREARAIAQIDHPHVVRIFDVVEHEGNPWIVMELVRGRSLYDEVKWEGPLDPARAARLGLDLVGALQAAHRVGVLHRDVKPANVLLGRDGRTVLTDFGLATSVGDSTMTRTGVMLGSPSYLAPERALDEPASAASDLWSLGATLYSAVEGRPPYVRSSPMATLAALTVDPPTAPKQAGLLEPVLEALLEKDPAARATAAEATELLRYVLSEPNPRAVEPPVETAAPPVRTEPPRPTRRRRGPVVVLLATATAVAVATAAALFAGQDPPDVVAQFATSPDPVDRQEALVPLPAVEPSARASATPGRAPSSPSSRPARPSATKTPSSSAPPVRPTASKSPSPAPIRLTFEAESYTDNNGTEDSFPPTASGGRAVGHTDNGDHVGYRNRSLAGVRKVALRYAAGGGDTVIELRSDSATGTLLATVALRGTANFSTHATATATLDRTTSGPLFIVFRGPKASDIDTVTYRS